MKIGLFEVLRPLLIQNRALMRESYDEPSARGNVCMNKGLFRVNTPVLALPRGYRPLLSEIRTLVSEPHTSPRARGNACINTGLSCANTGLFKVNVSPCGVNIRLFYVQRAS